MTRSAILFIIITFLFYSCNSNQPTQPIDKNAKLLEGIFCKWHQINDTTYDVYITEVNDTCKLYRAYFEIDKTEIHYLKKNGKANVRVIYIENKDTISGKAERIVQALIPIY